MDKQGRNDEGVNGDKKRKAGEFPMECSIALVGAILGAVTDLSRGAEIYDEDIEGFQFSRITDNKKQKASKDSEKPDLPVPEEPAPQPSPRRGRPPKKKVEQKPSNVTETKKDSEGAVKRKTRGSARTAPEPEPQPQPQTERSTRATRKRDEGEQVTVERKRKKGRPSKSHEEQPNGFVSPEAPSAGTATIALPMADTPVIQRNREMRGKKSAKGSRRSSLSMRGRRASSLIDSGASNGEKARVCY